MNTNQVFTVQLLFEAEPSPEANAAADGVQLLLNTIQHTRKHIRFDITHRRVAQNSTLKTRSLDTVLLDNSSNGISIGSTHLTAVIRNAGWGLGLHRFCVPSIQVDSTTSDTHSRTEDLDVKVLCLDGDSNLAIDRENRTGDASIDRLISTCISVAKTSESADGLIIGGLATEQASILGRFPTLPSRIEEYFRDKVSHLSTKELLSRFARDPTTLNGVILTDPRTASDLNELAKLIQGAHLTFGNISSLSGTSSVFGLSSFGSDDRQLHHAVNEALAVRSLLDSLGLSAEANALCDALRRTLDPVSYVGSNLVPISLGGKTSETDFLQVLSRHLAFFLESINSIDDIGPQSSTLPRQISSPETGTRPMNLIEKIITHSAVGLKTAEVTTGQMVCVHVDWTLTSELLWGGMEKTYDQMNRPRPYRNDRIWLAVDHTVDPRTINLPKQQRLMRGSERFRDEAKIINYLPANTSIMHTDFTREKAQPGTIVVGSDSHTCSAGSMGTFAVGFGAADVVMPLVTGQTWFRVPEVCRINFVGKPAYGITGKDVILHVLGLFKRNTIAFQRGVEYGGPSLHELSIDARFAIANMTTEFGGMGTCFEADEMTAAWVNGRRFRQDRKGGSFFRPDGGARYAEVRTIDLSEVAFTMALYPNPDDVVDITSKAGMHLDGCFIGACTTTEEELILGALTLEAGLRSGLKPSVDGKRRVTPGSLIITNRLDRLGLLQFYRDAGFEIGAPGCSYCVGINDVDVAQEGEVWLSSQNRNFRNRMGMGSIGNITSAAAVAASSFGMRIVDPKPLLDLIDSSRYALINNSPKTNHLQALVIKEPSPPLSTLEFQPPVPSLPDGGKKDMPFEKPKITGKIQRFGENIDTDAIIPAEYMPGVDNNDLGTHCFQYYKPEFRYKAATGSTIIVAEHGFGSGSSREDAVRALLGAGVQAVIAKSFAFIYERNQLNMGLYNAIILDQDFYEHAHEDKTITIDRVNNIITLEGIAKAFPFEHTKVEESLLEAGGIMPLYKLHGRQLFRNMTLPSASDQHLEAETKPVFAEIGSLDDRRKGDGLDW